MQMCFSPLNCALEMVEKVNLCILSQFFKSLNVFEHDRRPREAPPDPAGVPRVQMARSGLGGRKGHSVLSEMSPDVGPSVPLPLLTSPVLAP